MLDIIKLAWRRVAVVCGIIFLGDIIIWRSWRWLLFHAIVFSLAALAGVWSGKRKVQKQLREYIAIWGGDASDIDAEMQTMPRPPRDWHLVVRGRRYENIDLVYLGPILVPGDHLLPHWCVAKPVAMPDDVKPDEVQLVGEFTEACVVDLWFSKPKGSEPC